MSIAARVGQLHGGARAQIHHEDVGVAALLQTHDDAMAVVREARRKCHAGEIADGLALAGLDVEQIDPRLSLPVGHVGDFLRRRREARREHKIVAAREIAHIGAVLIHDRETLRAPVAGAGLVDEDDAGVEIAHLAGEALVDLVGDDVGEAPVVVRRWSRSAGRAGARPQTTSQSRNCAATLPLLCRSRRPVTSASR